ncbi:hypothetical protein M427DRAFT_32960 [Gonapodya prolifera JEL478]|uniref:C2H2-type domain-containing protein n=1 Tax=Gonapodya prolifera (strain JEL478) TaxID=1344416 RepID=A0A139AD52_GONPJ|nr:hypothetical protein M427DRAFT_32960 [Gonapodya prolifera JEL478]|eukprot:KXS14756.1 hypothetical protein M427DRAFT_32960 [Gonapodya prolifera JEL478]
MAAPDAVTDRTVAGPSDQEERGSTATAVGNPNLRKADKEKPFSCDVCGQSFSRRFNLKTHMAIHDPTRSKIVCDVCGLKFYRSGDLTRHWRMHALGHRPFVCEHCGKDFARQDRLRLHIETGKCPNLDADGNPVQPPSEASDETPHDGSQSSSSRRPSDVPRAPPSPNQNGYGYWPPDYPTGAPMNYMNPPLPYAPQPPYPYSYPSASYYPQYPNQPYYPPHYPYNYPGYNGMPPYPMPPHPGGPPFSQPPYMPPPYYPPPVPSQDYQPTANYDPSTSSRRETASGRSSSERSLETLASVTAYAAGIEQQAKDGAPRSREVQPASSVNRRYRSSEVGSPGRFSSTQQGGHILEGSPAHAPPAAASILQSMANHSTQAHTAAAPPVVSSSAPTTTAISSPSKSSMSLSAIRATAEKVMARGEDILLKSKEKQSSTPTVPSDAIREDVDSLKDVETVKEAAHSSSTSCGDGGSPEPSKQPRELRDRRTKDSLLSTSPRQRTRTLEPLSGEEREIEEELEEEV